MTELVDVVNSREHQRIILIPSQSSADFFLEHIYAHNYSFVIVTADQSYPKDKKVRDLLWEKIDNDFKTTIIILGRLDKDIIERLKKSATENILSMNKILTYDLRVIFPYEDQEYGHKMKMNFTKEKFSHLMGILNQEALDEFDIELKNQTNRFDIKNNTQFDPYVYNEEKGGVEYNWKAILSQNLDPDFFYECTKEEAEINRIKTKV